MSINNFENNEWLIEQLKIGNEQAYIYIVKSFHKPLYAYAVSLTNDKFSAEDIIQNVFLKTWEHRKSLNSNFYIKSFLFKTTYNEFINQYHKNRATSRLEKLYIDALNETVIDNNIEDINKRSLLLNEAIRDLPNKCKEVFLLSKKEGLSNFEIAEYLNISTKTVEGHISKAYQFLRKRLVPKLAIISILLLNSLKFNNTSAK